MVDYDATSGNFGIKKEPSGNHWLYWCGHPLKHLTSEELGDLKLLLNTSTI